MARSSPFPGMDPWLETEGWEGVHHYLITYAAEQLNESLPRGMRARVDERVFVGYAEGDRRSIRPDVFVVKTSGNAINGAESTALLDEPIIIRSGGEPTTEGFIEIMDAARGDRVITALEFLSLTNKATSIGRKMYLQKRDEYHQAKVSVVEVDLLRGGEHLVDVPPGYLNDYLRTPYKACVRRGWKLDAAESEYYRISLRSKLPRIRVPLRQDDPDVALDLQWILDTTYRRGRYDETNYSRPLDPPLSKEDAAWAAEQIEHWNVAPD